MPLTPFPCPLERTAASALLLLSSEVASVSPPPPPLPPPPSCVDVESIKDISANSSSKESIDSKPCSSSITSNVTPEQVQAPKPRAARSYEFKLQAAQRARSKTIKISDEWNPNTCATASIALSGFESTKAASSLTSSSSAGSSARSSNFHRVKHKCQVSRFEAREGLCQKLNSTSHMRRRADAILEFLSEGCASEVKIRRVLGDSPDTSKALRMLLKSEEVKRLGTGGRLDPYIYMRA